MTARPHNQFKVPGLTAKMVDLCIYASPDDDDEWMARIDQFSHQSPTQTVNHTDFEPIGMRPLLLSIETKKPGVHWDKAQLQMGLWHAAQWSFLAWAVGQKLTRQRSMDVAGETVDVDEREQPGDVGETVDDHVDKTQVATELQLEERRRAALSALGCLPGIIVQGHQWHLVMSSYDAKSGKTTLWADHQFGTTQGYLEIYGTIAGVRRLTAWARDVYLPWFEKHVLD